MKGAAAGAPSKDSIPETNFWTVVMSDLRLEGTFTISWPSRTLRKLRMSLIAGIMSAVIDSAAQSS